MTDFEQRLQAIQAHFVERAATDAQNIEQQAAAGNWHAVRDLSHAIVGRAGMFGFLELSETARTLESAVDNRIAAEGMRDLSRALVAGLLRLQTSD